jgi:peptidoglycan hydrolase-like protein with peptidoglycan-binding domain
MGVKKMALQKGNKGSEVTALQEQLSAMGFYAGNLDGSFGAGTETAVKKFQWAKNLNPDGHVGPATRDALTKPDFEILTLDQLTARLANYNHKEFHVHCTAAPDFKQYYAPKAANDDERAITRQRSMRSYHVNTRGWKDIGQHVTLIPDGRFVTGRAFNHNPASIDKEHNPGAFMMEMIGNFDKGHDPYQGEQRRSAVGLGRWFDQRGKYIRFHNENSSKTCPGSGIPKASFMAEVRMGPTPEPTPKPDPDTIYRVQVGAYKNKSGADALAKELQSKGYSTIVK